MIDKKSLVAYNRALVNYFKNNLKEYTEKNGTIKLAQREVGNATTLRSKEMDCDKSAHPGVVSNQ